MHLTIESISKSYGNRKALDSVSFSIAPGEIVGYLGPNGAGKSTTMKILTGYLAPDSGRVLLGSQSIEGDLIDFRSRLGYLPENNPLYLDMYVADHLEWSASLHGLKGAAASKRIHSVLNECGLEKEANRRIGQLSKGYRQRVGLAQALIHNPELLILDEPTTGLDPNQIIEIRELIRELGKSKSILLSTHILPEAEALADRILIIADGRIRASGTPASLTGGASSRQQIHLEIETAQAEDEIKKSISALGGVEGLESISANRFSITTTDDIRRELFTLAVSKGWIILEMTKTVQNLEDVFHSLTLKDNE